MMQNILEARPHQGKNTILYFKSQSNYLRLSLLILGKKHEIMIKQYPEGNAKWGKTWIELTKDKKYYVYI